MKFIFNKYIPFKGYAAMCVGNLVFVRNGVQLSERIINHESIHSAQWRECLYLFFLPIYVCSFLLQLLKFVNWHEAYRNVCFEREAYGHQDEDDYLSHRKRFAWI